MTVDGSCAVLASKMSPSEAGQLAGQPLLKLHEALSIGVVYESAVMSQIERDRPNMLTNRDDRAP